MTDKEQIEEMASIINDEKDVCVRMQGLMDCKYCTCKNENGECGFAEYISRTLFTEGCCMQTTEKNSAVQWHKVADGDLPKKDGEYIVVIDYTKEFKLKRYDVSLYRASDRRFSYSEVFAWTELLEYKE